MRNRDPYFRQSQTVELISSLARKSNISIVTGAGWSADWGLPSWRTLVHQMLAGPVAWRYRIGGDAERLAFAKSILDTHDLIGAASVVREALDDAFESDLTKTLYAARMGETGQAARMVARLRYVWASHPDARVTLITLNYDQSLEVALASDELSALREEQKITEIRSIALDRGHNELPILPKNVLPVFHLHGVVPVANGASSALVHTPNRGRLIFSEEDYFQDTGVTHTSLWQASLLNECLTDPNGACLFVGMSLSDPNVLRHLFSAELNSGRSNRPIVFLPLQGYPRFSEASTVDVDVRHAMRKRLAKIGVHTESPDFFSQVPQVLNEITFSRRSYLKSGRQDAKAKNHYSPRLQGWRSLMEDAAPPRFNLDDDDEFARIQTANTAVLRATRVLIYSIVDDYLRSQQVRERFAVQLWARNPHQGSMSLEMWGSSEKAWLERESILRAPIEPDSHYNAVRAFCSGGVLIERSDKVGSRWARSVACLIYLGGKAWSHLPVGAIVLESNFDEDSCLSKLDGSQREAVSVLLRTVGEALLDPNVAVATVRDAMSRLTADGAPTVGAATTAIRRIIDHAQGEGVLEANGRDRARWIAQPPAQLEDVE